MRFGKASASGEAPIESVFSFIFKEGLNALY